MESKTSKGFLAISVKHCNIAHIAIYLILIHLHSHKNTYCKTAIKCTL